jgi:D-lactate dehydrogenase
MAQYDTDSLQEAIPEGSDLTFTFTEALLDNKTAALAKGHDAVCLFVNDIM